MYPALQDVPLFEGITSDLFPGVVLPKPDYDSLTDALEYNIKKAGLQAVPWFITKVIQVLRNIPVNRLLYYVKIWINAS